MEQVAPGSVELGPAVTIADFRLRKMQAEPCPSLQRGSVVTGSKTLAHNPMASRCGHTGQRRRWSATVHSNAQARHRNQQRREQRCAEYQPQVRARDAGPNRSSPFNPQQRHDQHYGDGLQHLQWRAMPIDDRTLQTFDGSLVRCNANPAFLDRFYTIFLASSPKVREKFVHTDFARQKVALRASFSAMLAAARGQTAGSSNNLNDLAERHSSRQLNIGAEFYDLWLDSLLAAVKECDPQYDGQVRDAWERVMMVGIGYLLSRY
jgi:hemoglobin-like flavoprotein